MESMRQQLLFAFITALCLPALAGAQDNNDSFATADPIDFGQTVSGAINPEVPWHDFPFCCMKKPMLCTET